MKYINLFKKHSSYEAEINGGGVDVSLPNVSYCEDIKDVHYNPYNTVEFYVGEITTPQTVKIYTDETNHVDVEVSEGNKWYSYVLPKDKGLCKIESGTYNSDDEEWSNGIVKKAIIKANINYNYNENNDTYNGIVPWEITDVSFKGSNTSNVTNMRSMFNECSKLTLLDLSSFDTSKVTDMEYMFNYCSSLTSLNLSSFNTSKVTDMESMFGGCTKLKSLDVSNFNTSNVTSMRDMFSECNNLISLDLSKFDTSNVTSMQSMFFYCSGLTSLNLSGWGTSNLINMVTMFESCTRLQTLDLSGWDTSKVTDMNNMFKGCTSLNTITMTRCSEGTVKKVKAQLKADGLSENIVKQ